MLPSSSSFVSPAGSAFANSYGGSALQQQREEETDDVRKKKMQQAQTAGYSPAGASLISQGTISVGPL